MVARKAGNKTAIKLLDFGLAKRNTRELGPDDETGAALSKDGQITGTLQYIMYNTEECTERDVAKRQSNV
jgi:hypothetical protein